jgi:heme oxygenase
MMADILDGGTRMALRQATSAAHQRLHHLAGFAALQAGTIGPDAYADLLRRLFAFHRAVEQALAAASPLHEFGIDIAARRRSSLLLDDLAFLGAAAAPLPAPPILPALGSAAQALGCLYVTEGSTLGGRELARRLDHLLAPGSAEGRRFLLGHGPHHGTMWREFCAALELCGGIPERRAEMIGTALAVFAVFGSWFGPREVGPGETAAAA